MPDSTETRLAIAEADVLAADRLNLAAVDNATLVAMVVRLRGSLADVIRICRDNDTQHPPQRL